MPVELSPKEAAKKLLDRSGEDATYEDIIYELHVLQKIERGLNDVKEGNTTPHEQVKEEFKKWLIQIIGRLKPSLKYPHLNFPDIQLVRHCAFRCMFIYTISA